MAEHVHREFEAYLKCGRLEHGFLRVRCDKCHFERLVAFSCKKRGFCRGRFLWVCTLVHLVYFDILFLDGAYVYRDKRPPRFQLVKAPDKGELEGLVHLISQRVGRCLERQGLLEQDAEIAWQVLVNV